MASVLHTYGSYFGISTSMNQLPGSAVGATGDLLSATGGELSIATTGDTIVGVLQETMADSATTYYKYNDTPFLAVALDNDNDSTTFAATHVFSRFDIDAGGTGAQVVDTSTADGTLDGTETGTLMCVEYNPQGIGYDDDTSVGKFVIVQTPFLAVA